MWSLGAILGEMLRGRPVFKEDDHVELLKKHIFICGTPDDATLQLYESEQVSFLLTICCGVLQFNSFPSLNFEFCYFSKLIPFFF